VRSWLNASMTAAAHVADRSELWLPGALAWMVTVGWLALLLGVARPPTVAELTFLGAGIVTSGQWPWNGIAILGATVALTGAAIALASVAEATLHFGRRAGPAAVGRIVVVGLVCVLPLAVTVAALIVALSFVAPGEFNDPEAGAGPLVGTIVTLAPFIVAVLVAAAIGGAIHAAAIRSGDGDEAPWNALAAAPARLARTGTGVIGQALALLLARVGYLLVSATLLRVLWAPIDARLGTEGFGLAAIGLLVGFVAIWICLVLGGGALHAWGSVSWTRILDVRRHEAGSVADMESRSRP
jgi:hypothetical protein